MSGQFKTEVTRGTFDPRTYKTVDKDNWARKRKPEWMSTTGQIHFVRERQVPVPTPIRGPSYFFTKVTAKLTDLFLLLKSPLVINSIKFICFRKAVKKLVFFRT